MQAPLYSTSRQSKSRDTSSSAKTEKDIVDGGRAEVDQVIVFPGNSWNHSFTEGGPSSREGTQMVKLGLPRAHPHRGPKILWHRHLKITLREPVTVIIKVDLD